LITDVDIRKASIDKFAELVDADVMSSLMDMAHHYKAVLAGRTVWNINSTAAGGGVAELLRPLLGYAQGLGFDARWSVISGDGAFFRVTKRLHNALHGAIGDGSPLGPEQRAAYEHIIELNTAPLKHRIKSDDLVILHDPQTAGLIPHLKPLCAGVMWRCHVGHDGWPSEVENGWEFLRPYIAQADRLIFSREAYVPHFVDRSGVAIIPPVIDPFSAKNMHLDRNAVSAILTKTGVVRGNHAGEHVVFKREDGSHGRIERLVRMQSANGLPTTDCRMVLQVSRWDRLKDPVGVLKGFAALVENHDIGPDVVLVLAGPETAAVSDDPEGADVYSEVVSEWEALPTAVRSRCYLASIPMDDREENAVIVNAMQRHAAVIVQKSLREGFGLTVTEAMWKARPIVASRVGGIQDQIQDCGSGVLLSDPHDLDDFSRLLARVLTDQPFADSLGAGAYSRVLAEYLVLGSLMRFGRLLADVLNDRPAFDASRVS